MLRILVNFELNVMFLKFCTASGHPATSLDMVPCSFLAEASFLSPLRLVTE